jgi:hypothetical protein
MSVQAVERRHDFRNSQGFKLAVFGVFAAIVLSIGYSKWNSEWAQHNVSHCVNFANDLRAKKELFARAYKIEPGRSWVKNGHAVVEIREYEKADSTLFRVRLCVVGDDTIRIVSGLEHWRWE